MKTPPPHGLTCAAGVFVLGRYCPYSGESCRCTEARRTACQHRSKCHLPDTLLPRGDGEVRLPHRLSAGQHSPIQAVALYRRSPPAPRNSPGSLPAPEEMPSSRHAPCPGVRKARPPHRLSAGQHSLIQAVTLYRRSPPAPGNPPGSLPAPEEIPSPRHAPCPEGTEQFACLCAPKQKRRLRPGKTRLRAACCFYQAAEELSSSLLVWDSASSGFSGSAVSSSSGI